MNTKDPLSPWGNVNRLLESDTVLASQFYPPSYLLSCGELRLMRAVMEQTLDSIKRNSRLRESRRARRLLQEDLEWIENDDEQWPFSFLGICFNLGLEAERVRKAIRAMGGQLR